MLEALAGSAAKGALDVLVDRNKQARQSHYYKENQDYLYGIQQKSQRNTYQNAVASLDEAGLNPAIAANASGMSVGTAPSTSPSGFEGAPNPEFGMIGSRKELAKKQGESLDSQIELNQSGVEKNAADAGKAIEEANYYNQLAGQLKRSNTDYDEKRFFFSEIAMEYLGALRAQAVASNDEARVKVIDNLLDMKEQSPDLYFSPALVDAFNLLNSGSVANQEHYTKIINDKLREMVAAGQIQSTPELEALIHAPTREAAAMWKQIQAASKNIELLGQQKEINEADLRKIEAEIIELGKSAARMDAETQKAYSSDVTRMLREGDYLGVGLQLFRDLGNPITLAILMSRGFKPSSPPPVKTPPVPKAPVPKGMGSALESSGVKVGETRAAERYHERVSVPFQQQIEYNKAQGDFRRFYKKYKREHDH